MEFAARLGLLVDSVGSKRSPPDKITVRIAWPQFGQGGFLLVDSAPNKRSLQTMSKYITAKPLAERYGICERTLDRWVEAGALPPPVKIQGRKYWLADELDRADEARKVAS
jgi:predicted DNA-binding transcriptional regulator AlpA